MIGTIVGWVCIGIGVLIALGWLVALVLAKLPSVVPQSVANIVDLVGDRVDQAAALTALTAVAIVCWKQGDSESVGDLSKVRDRIRQWAKAPPPA